MFATVVADMGRVRSELARKGRGAGCVVCAAGVLQPQRDEGRDGQPDGDKFAGRVFGLEGHVRGHTDEPVAEDGAYEDDEQRLVRLSEGNLLSGGRLAERAAGSHQRREEDASEQVAGPRGCGVWGQRGAVNCPIRLWRVGAEG